MVQVTHDGNFLPRPMTVKGFRIAVAQRVDIASSTSARCRAAPSSTWSTARSRTTAAVPRAGSCPCRRATRCSSSSWTATIDTKGDPSRIPDKFFDLPDINRNEGGDRAHVRVRPPERGWSVNGRQFNPDRITANPRLGTAEIWNFVNNSGGWMHPVHIHMEEHQQILRATASRRCRTRSAREDVVLARPRRDR